VQLLGAAERVVIQAKLRDQLDAQVDRLLCVGDELVSVQGVPLSHCGGSFKEKLEYIRAAPRPLQLGFLPGSARNL
jgi:hypothetical protein